MRKFLLAFATLANLPLMAQQTQPVSTPQPNLILQFPFTAVGTSPVIDNRQIGALSFTLTVSVPTTISVLSLQFETAQDNGSANCSTCSWTAATAATGSNPNTLTTGWNATFSTALTTYYAYVRLNLTAKTGTGIISAKLYSSIAGGGGGGGGGGTGCAGTTATPCIVAGPDSPGNPPTQAPVLIAGQDASASNVTTILTDNNGDVQTQIVGNAAVLSGQQAVTAAAVALANHNAKNACIKALVGNTINVYVGTTAVTIGTGMELAPGDAVCLPIINTNLLYVIASTTGASVSWVLTN